MTIYYVTFWLCGYESFHNCTMMLIWTFKKKFFITSGMYCLHNDVTLTLSLCHCKAMLTERVIINAQLILNLIFSLSLLKLQYFCIYLILNYKYIRKKITALIVSIRHQKHFCCNLDKESFIFLFEKSNRAIMWLTNLIAFHARNSYLISEQQNTRPCPLMEFRWFCCSCYK